MQQGLLFADIHIWSFIHVRKTSSIWSSLQMSNVTLTDLCTVPWIDITAVGLKVQLIIPRYQLGQSNPFYNGWFFARALE
jgi:hypothetical protein